MTMLTLVLKVKGEGQVVTSNLSSMTTTMDCKRLKL